MRAHQPLQNVAYDYLYHMILSGDLDTSITYSSTKIAQEIGISRTPMRDALQRLSQDGYIDVLPSMGFRIRKLATSDIIEVVQIRCAIESYCGDALGQDVKIKRPEAKETLETMKNIMEQMEAIPLTEENIKTFIKLDNEFHIAFVYYVNNPLFCETYQKYLYQIQQFLYGAMHQPMRMANTLTEHQSIYNAILQGDTLNIFYHIKDHLNKASSYLLQECSEK